MAEIQGGVGRDWLVGSGAADSMRGGAGNDTLEGGAGSDTLSGGAGTDLLFGGEGDDFIFDSGKRGTLLGGLGDDTLVWSSRADGAALLDGGAGNDRLDAWVGLGIDADITVFGGEGDDNIRISGAGNARRVLVDAGSGDDVVHIYAGIAAEVTLGAGADSLVVRPAPYPYGYGYADLYGHGAAASPVVVTDYQPGQDRLRLGFDDGSGRWSNWSGSENPFGSGYLRLVQRGADTVLQIDADGEGEGSDFTDVVVFRNIAVEAFSAADFEGFSPDGSAAPGDVFVAIPVGSFIDGTVGPDRIEGMDGADTLNGFAGDDTLDGGDGDDWIEGGPGNDQLSGGGGNDVLWDNGWSTILLGGDGGDSLIWHATDTDGRTGHLDGGPGDDYLSVWADRAKVSTTVIAQGGPGNDYIFLAGGLFGVYTVDGGQGDDVINLYSQPSTTVTLGEGADSAVLPYFVDWLNVEVVTITDYSPGEDVLDVRFGYSVCYGWDWSGEGNPFGSGYARLTNQGVDTVLQIDADGRGSKFGYADVLRLQNVFPSALSGADFNGYSPDGSMPAGQVIEGTGESESLTGTVSSDLMLGGDGDDMMDGRAGDDMIEGGDGNDALSGGFGDDTIEGGDGNDAISDGLGDDQLSGGRGDDSLGKWGGNGSLLGGEGNDWLNWHANHADSGLLDGGAGNDTIYASQSYDNEVQVQTTMLGGDGDDSITYYGRDGYPAHGDSDQVTMLGGEGDDTVTYYGESAEQRFVLDAGDGNDAVYVHGVSTSSVTLGAGADRLVLEWNWASDLQNVVVEDYQSGEDVLDIDFGDMYAWAGSTNPFYDGFASLRQEGADTLLQIAASGTGFQAPLPPPPPPPPMPFRVWLSVHREIVLALDRLHQLSQAPVRETAHTALRFSDITPAEFSATDFGGFEPNAGAYFEAVYGGSGADALTGTAAANRLVGRGGGDTLTGGDGADEFVFNAILEGAANPDHVTDFRHGEDKLVLDREVFDLLVAGGLALQNFSSGSTGAAADADDFVVYNQVTGELSYDADGDGAGASLVIALLGSTPALSATDFLVV